MPGGRGRGGPAGVRRLGVARNWAAPETVGARRCPVPDRASFADARCPAGLEAEMPGRRPSVREQLPPGVSPAVREARSGRGRVWRRRPQAPTEGISRSLMPKLRRREGRPSRGWRLAARWSRRRARLRWGLLQASRLHLPGLPASTGGTASSLVPSPCRPPLSLSLLPLAG